MKLTSLLLLFCAFALGQNKPLVIIKNQYEFQKKPNEYNINTILKVLFESCNYEVLFENDALTTEQAENACSNLKANLIDNSGMFKTIVKLELVDCYNKVIFSTPQVSSSEKDYQAAYLEAIKKLQPELRKHVVKKQENVPQNNLKQETETSYFAKSIANGFELYNGNDTTSKKGIYLLYNTSNPDVFIATKNDGNITHGVVIKKDNQFYFEYNKNGVLKSDILQIKF
jgi:hypothetical protein